MPEGTGVAVEARCAGHLDYFGPEPNDANRDVVGGDISAGDALIVRGWLFDEVSQRVPASATVYIDRKPACRVPVAAFRDDVRSKLGAAAAKAGVDVRLPPMQLRPGVHDVELGADFNGSTKYVGNAITVRVVQSPVVEPDHDDAVLPGTSGFDDVRDASLAVEIRSSRLIGRRHSVMFAAWALDPEYRPFERAYVRIAGGGHAIWIPARRHPSGRAMAVRAVRRDRHGGWIAHFDTRRLPVGAYRAELWAGASDGPVRRAGGATFVILPRGPLAYREGLASLYTPARGAVTFFGRERWSDGESRDFQRGDYVRVEGWAEDPASGRAPRAAFAIVDGRRATSLVVRTMSRSTSDDAERVDFGGIVDTEPLTAGRHVARIVAQNSSATGLYDLGTFEFDVVDAAAP